MPHASLAAIRRRDPIARVGLAILIGVIALVSTGGWIWWRLTDARRVRLDLFFENSVHGISVGTPVKILGVAVGQVESLGVRLPSRYGPSHYAAVSLVLDGDRLAAKGLPSDLDDMAVLRDEIARGLYGRLRVLSPMTGSMYVELGYDVDDPAVLVSDPHENIAEVPTRRDPLADGLIEATHKMAEIGSMDLLGMEKDLRARLDRLRAATDPAIFTELNATVLEKLGQTREALASAPLKEALAEVNARTRDVRVALEKLNAGVDGDISLVMEAAARLREALATAGERAEVVGRALDPRTPALLVAYSRLALLREEASGIRAVCERILNARGVLETLFLSTSMDDGAEGR